MLSKLRADIIRKNQVQTGDSEIDRTRNLAKKALEGYLSLPVLDEIQEGESPDASNDTFIFWRNFSKTNNKAEKALAHLARIHLTPPPTSTGMIYTMESRILTHSSRHGNDLLPC